MVSTAKESQGESDGEQRPAVFHHRFLRKPVKLLGAGAVVALAGIGAASPETLMLALTNAVRASLSVSANVYPFARINSVGAPAQIDLTATNIAAGYVDFSDLPISLSHNTPKGFTLWVTFDPRVVKHVHVELEGVSVELTAPNSPVAVPLAPGLIKPVHARFRIELAPGVTQGSFRGRLRSPLRHQSSSVCHLPGKSTLILPNMVVKGVLP